MRLMHIDSHCKSLGKCLVQKHIQNPVKPLRWNVLLNLLTIFPKHSFLDVWQDSEYASVEDIYQDFCSNCQWALISFVILPCFFLDIFSKVLLT